MVETARCLFISFNYWHFEATNLQYSRSHHRHRLPPPPLLHPLRTFHPLLNLLHSIRQCLSYLLLWLSASSSLSTSVSSISLTIYTDRVSPGDSLLPFNVEEKQLTIEERGRMYLQRWISALKGFSSQFHFGE